MSIKPHLPPIYVPFKAACASARVTPDTLRHGGRVEKLVRARGIVASALRSLGYDWEQIGNVMHLSGQGAMCAASRVHP